MTRDDIIEVGVDAALEWLRGDGRPLHEWRVRWLSGRGAQIMAGMRGTMTEADVRRLVEQAVDAG